MKRRCATASTPWTATSDRKSTRLNSSHDQNSYAVFCLKKKKALVEELLGFLAWVEAYIDFPDEHLLPERRQLVWVPIDRVGSGINRLLDPRQSGTWLHV